MFYTIIPPVVLFSGCGVLVRPTSHYDSDIFWSIEACHRHCPKSFRDEGGYHIVNIVNITRGSHHMMFNHSECGLSSYHVLRFRSIPREAGSRPEPSVQPSVKREQPATEIFLFDLDFNHSHSLGARNPRHPRSFLSFLPALHSHV